MNVLEDIMNTTLKFGTNKEEIENNKLKTYCVKDKNGKDHFIRADAFTYLGNDIAWFYDDKTVVASFDDPLYITNLAYTK